MKTKKYYILLALAFVMMLLPSCTNEDELLSNVDETAFIPEVEVMTSIENDSIIDLPEDSMRIAVLKKK